MDQKKLKAICANGLEYTKALEESIPGIMDIFMGGLGILEKIEDMQAYIGTLAKDLEKYKTDVASMKKEAENVKAGLDKERASMNKLKKEKTEISAKMNEEVAEVKVKYEKLVKDEEEAYQTRIKALRKDQTDLKDGNEKLRQEHERLKKVVDKFKSSIQGL
jgi:predicted nuclease with TOPRIM domain